MHNGRSLDSNKKFKMKTQKKRSKVKKTSKVIIKKPLCFPQLNLTIHLLYKIKFVFNPEVLFISDHNRSDHALLSLLCQNFNKN